MINFVDDDFLPRPRLARNQYDGLDVGDDVHQMKYLLHGRAVGHDGAAAAVEQGYFPHIALRVQPLLFQLFAQRIESRHVLYADDDGLEAVLPVEYGRAGAQELLLLVRSRHDDALRVFVHLADQFAADGMLPVKYFHRPPQDVAPLDAEGRFQGLVDPDDDAVFIGHDDAVGDDLQNSVDFFQYVYDVVQFLGGAPLFPRYMGDDNAALPLTGLGPGQEMADNHAPLYCDGKAPLPMYDVDLRLQRADKLILRHA